MTTRSCNGNYFWNVTNNLRGGFPCAESDAEGIGRPVPGTEAVTRFLPPLPAAAPCGLRGTL